MTAASTIITRAFRQENLIATGASETTAEQTEALALLNALISQIIGFDLGELVYDFPIPWTNTAPYEQENPRDPYDDTKTGNANKQPPNNSRIVGKITSATTVYFPQWPNDGSRIAFTDVGSTSSSLTLDGNGRQIESAATITIDPTSVTEREWFYRADLGSWERVTTLATGDNVPFPLKYDLMLETGLAILLCPRHSREPSATTQSIYNSLRAKFKAQYKQEIPTPSTHHLANVQSWRTDQGNIGEFAGG